MVEDDDRSALRSQGMIADEILVPEKCIADDVDLVASVVDFVNWAMDRARLIFGEIATEAFWSYHVDYYLAQVANGGHGQFAHNSGMREQSLDNCRRGLIAMGAEGYVRIFDDFMAIMNGDAARAKAIQEGSGFGEIDPAIEALDRRFGALENLTTLNAAWLRALPALRPLPSDRLNAERDAIIARNPLLAAREDYVRRAEERHAATDTVQVAARATCAQEGIAFEGVNAGFPVPGGVCWGLRTSAGSRWLIVSDEMAALRTKGALRGLYFFETNAEYPVAVGDGALRRTLMAASGRDVRTRIRTAAQDADARTPSAFPEAVLAEFLGPALEAFWGAFTSRSKQINSAIVVPYLGANASHVSFVPRASSPLLAMSEDHALLRLIIANALWDSVVVSDALDDSMLADPDAAGALLANLGAAAVVAATSVRLLDRSRIRALSLLAPDDLVREQHNVRFQLLEIARWWFSFVPAAVAAFSKTQFPRSSSSAWLFFNICGRNAKLLDKKLRPIATNGLQDALAYFDREYPAIPASRMASTYGRALNHFLSGFGNSKKQVKAWVGVVSTLRGMIASDAPFDGAAIFVVTAEAAKIRTRDKIVGAATVSEGERFARQAFIFSKHGERVPLQHDP